MKPRDANTMTDVDNLDRYHAESGDYEIIVDSEMVYLSEGRFGGDIKAAIAIHKKHFDKLIDFYNADEGEG